MARMTKPWTTVAGADGVTWDSLMAGEGWSPLRILRLRAFAGAIVGLPGALPRDQFGPLLGTSERSLCRWEDADAEPLMVPGPIYRKAFASYARDHLNDEQRLQLLQI